MPTRKTADNIRNAGENASVNNKSLSIASVQELIAYAKANPARGQTARQASARRTT